MARSDRFEQRFGGLYTCGNCKKQTRETGDGESSVELCARCYYEAGLENEHSDNGGHAPPHPDCPYCREAPRAAPLADSSDDLCNELKELRSGDRTSVAMWRAAFSSLPGSDQDAVLRLIDAVRVLAKGGA